MEITGELIEHQAEFWEALIYIASKAQRHKD